MEEVNRNKNAINFTQPYTSCIVIKGRPILPPVMTPFIVNEMHQYKLLALEVERRLRNHHSNAIQLHSLPVKSNIPSTEINSKGKKDGKQTDLPEKAAVEPDGSLNVLSSTFTQNAGRHSLERMHQLSSYNGRCRISPVQIITETSTPGADHSTPPSVASTDLAKYMAITTDYEDQSTLADFGNSVDSVHSYDSDSYHLEAPESASMAMSDRSNMTTAIPDENCTALTDSVIHDNFLDSDISDSSTKPIRRSSYTLEHPSPILVAHLQKLQRSTLDDDKLQLNETEQAAINKCEEKMTKNGSVTGDQSDRQEHLQRYLNQMASLNISNKTINVPSSQLNSAMTNVTDAKAVGVSLTSESVNGASCPDSQTLALEQFLQEQQHRFERLRAELEEAHGQQLLRLKSLDANLSVENKSPVNLNTEKGCVELPVQISLSKNEQEAFPSNFAAVLPSPPKFKMQRSRLETQQFLNSSSDIISSEGANESPGRIRAIKIPTAQFPFKFKTCNSQDHMHREVLMPPKIYDSDMKPKFDRLSAAVKGYLTRRLMRTEKVQTIIKTIQDTLEFAFQLHLETPLKEGRVTPEDADLHQRLIAQLSSACYEFHDTFFKLTTKEKMMLISQDRLLQQEKLSKENKAKKALPTTKQKHRLSSATLKAIERKRHRAITSRQSSKPPSPYFTKSRSPREDHSRKVCRQMLSCNAIRASSTSPRMQHYTERGIYPNLACYDTSKSESPHHRVRRSLYGQQAIVKAKRKTLPGRPRPSGARTAFV